MSIDKDKYLSRSWGAGSAGSSHGSQCCSPGTYSRALMFSPFSSGTVPRWSGLSVGTRGRVGTPLDDSARGFVFLFFV